MHLEERDLEKTIETSLFELRHRPLDNDINLFLLISRLHFELGHHKGLLLVKVIPLVLVGKDRVRISLAIGKERLSVVLLPMSWDNDEELSFLIFLFQSPELFLIYDLN